jgi:hypothetical protein
MTSSTKLARHIFANGWKEKRWHRRGSDAHVACSSTAVPPAWVLPCASASPAGRRADMDHQVSFFSRFPEMKPPSVPALLEAKMVKVFEEADPRLIVSDCSFGLSPVGPSFNSQNSGTF